MLKPLKILMQLLLRFFFSFKESNFKTFFSQKFTYMIGDILASYDILKYFRNAIFKGFKRLSSNCNEKCHRILFTVPPVETS